MLMDLAEEAGAGGDGEEWVATHTNAKGALTMSYLMLRGLSVAPDSLTHIKGLCSPRSER